MECWGEDLLARLESLIGSRDVYHWLMGRSGRLDVERARALALASPSYRVSRAGCYLLAWRVSAQASMYGERLLEAMESVGPRTARSLLFRDHGLGAVSRLAVAGFDVDTGKLFIYAAAPHARLLLALNPSLPEELDEAAVRALMGFDYHRWEELPPEGGRVRLQGDLVAAVKPARGRIAEAVETACHGGELDLEALADAYNPMTSPRGRPAVPCPRAHERLVYVVNGHRVKLKHALDVTPHSLEALQRLRPEAPPTLFRDAAEAPSAPLLKVLGEAYTETRGEVLAVSWSGVVSARHREHGEALAKTPAPSLVRLTTLY